MGCRVVKPYCEQNRWIIACQMSLESSPNWQNYRWYTPEVWTIVLCAWCSDTSEEWYQLVPNHTSDPKYVRLQLIRRETATGLLSSPQAFSLTHPWPLRLVLQHVFVPTHQFILNRLKKELFQYYRDDTCFLDHLFLARVRWIVESETIIPYLSQIKYTISSIYPVHR